MIRLGSTPYLECSSVGDRRFSAFHTRVKACGNRTIEDVYQAAKIFADGSTNLDWRIAKGKACVNQEEVRILYSDLWTCYIEENPHLLSVLKIATGLSDVYGQARHACKAEELWRIRNSD